MPTEKLFYIISLKHTSKGDAILTFWGPNGGGYTWHKNRAGIYTEEGLKGYASDENVAVPVELVDKYWINAQDYGDKYIAVQNTPQVLKALGLSDKFMKPKKFASIKRLTFVNNPVTP